MIAWLQNINFLAACIWIVITVLVYFAALHLHRASSRFRFIQPALHPLIVSTLLVVLLQWFAHTSVAEYQEYTSLLSALLGPATVGLAVPLYRQLRLMVKMNWRVLVPICVGGAIAPVLSWTCLYFLDTPLNLQMTVLVKSITTPLAMDAAHAIGGIPALAAVFVISTGIVGAICGPALFAVIGVNNQAAQGVSLGAVSHAIGTARAISISEQCTAFATLALCINGIATALILPILFG